MGIILHSCIVGILGTLSNLLILSIASLAQRLPPAHHQTITDRNLGLRPLTGPISAELPVAPDPRTQYFQKVDS
jgi:hypothetical protein